MSVPPSARRRATRRSPAQKRPHPATPPAAHRSESRAAGGTSRRTGPHPGGDDRGQITAAVAVLAVLLFALAGLVLDGGRALAAKAHALSLAAEAARAGAQQLDTATLRTTGVATLNPAAARDRATAFLTANNTTGTATATGETVTVTVTTRTATSLLGLIGVTTLTETATATASLITTPNLPGPP
jgi:Flp pilus assembly protein TadG